MSHGGNPKIVFFMKFSKYDGTSPYLTLQATYIQLEKRNTPGHRTGYNGPGVGTERRAPSFKCF